MSQFPCLDSEDNDTDSSSWAIVRVHLFMFAKCFIQFSWQDKYHLLDSVKVFYTTQDQFSP